jgi:hypothetical protein
LKQSPVSFWEKNLVSHLDWLYFFCKI